MAGKPFPFLDVALHALVLGFTDLRLRTVDAVFNALAIALFAATALAWRIDHGARGARESNS